MPERLRYAIYVAFGGLWLSGCGWLLLHSFCITHRIGEVRHPWEPALLLIHGVSVSSPPICLVDHGPSRGGSLDFA